jgi:EmrB/QacA subfamily drug resistance transporter
VPARQPGMERTSSHWVLAVTATASLMVALDALIVSTALTPIGRQFHASVEALEWTVNAYLLSLAVLQMSAAALGDRFGRRRVFIAGLALFAGASVWCALAPSIGALIAARALQGVGAAATMPLALTLLGQAFPPERRAGALTVYSSVTALSGILGPIAGGAVTQGLSWPWVFWLNVPLAIAVIAVAFARVPESRGAAVPIDVAGVALVTASAFGFVWALVRGNAAGWASAEVLGACTGGAAALTAFVWWERRAHAPMIPPALFAHRAFAASNATIFGLFGALMGAIFLLAQFAQIGLNEAPFASGVQLLPYGAALFLVAPHGLAAARALGNRATIVIGLVLQAGGLAALAAGAHPGASPLAFVVPMIAAGAGIALAMPIAQQAVLTAVLPHEIGKAAGTYSTVRQLGGAFGVAVAVAVFAAFGDRTSSAHFTVGFAPAMTALALLSIAAAGTAAALPERRKPAAVATAKTWAKDAA